MDIRNMKRKELQALCKKHKIPANLTNLEMANSLISLLKDNEKPMAKGKSCLRSSVELASENLSEGVTRQSKKVRFSPENETFEFFTSATKAEDEGRGARARKRSMVRQVEGIGGIVLEKEKNVDALHCSEDIVNNPVRVIRSRSEKLVDNTQQVFATKSVKRSLRSVAVESVSTANMLTRRSSENKQVEKNKEKSVDDAILVENQTKRTSRKRGTETENNRLLEGEVIIETEKVVRRSKRNAKQSESSVELNQGVGEVDVVGTGRLKRKRAQLVENAKVIEVALNTEPSTRSSRYGSRRQSILPQAEKMRTVGSKDKSESDTLVQNAASEDNARPNRNTSRRKSVAVSDVILVENHTTKKPGSRKRGLVLEEENGVLDDSSHVEKPPKHGRNSSRRQSIIPQKGDGSKGEVDNIIKSSAQEENANLRRQSSRRKLIVASDTSLGGNVRKYKATSRKMDPVLEEEHALIEVSSLIEELSREPLATVEDDKAVPLEERVSVGERGSSPVMNSTEILSDNVEKESTEVSGKSLVEKNSSENIIVSGKSLVEKNASEDIIDLNNTVSPIMTGLAETSSDSPRLQRNQVETEVSISISGIEVVLNINIEDEADKDKVLQDFNSSKSAPESEVESNVGKDVLLAEALLEESYSKIDQPDCTAENLDLRNELGTGDNAGLDVQVFDTVKLQDQEELLGLIENSVFEIVSDDNSKTEVDEEQLLEERKQYDDDFISDSVTPLCDVEPDDVVCPDATFEDEGYPPIDKSVCSGKHVDLDNSCGEEIIPSEVENIEIRGLESSAMVPPEILYGEKDYSRVNQPDYTCKPAQNLDSEAELRIDDNAGSVVQASNTLKFQDHEEFQGLIGSSSFKTVLDDDDHAEDQDARLQERKAYDVDFISSSSSLLKHEVVCPEATLGDESHPQTDQSVCRAKLDKNHELESEMDEDNKSGKQFASSSSMSDDEAENENKHEVVCPEATFEDESHPQIDPSVCRAKPDKNNELESEMGEDNESGKHFALSSSMSDDEAENENGSGSEEKNVVELEGYDNSFVEKNTPTELKRMESYEHPTELKGMECYGLERFEFSIGKEQPSVKSQVDELTKLNVEGPSAQHREFNSMEILVGIACEEPQDESVLNEIVEKENFKFVNNEGRESSSPDTSDQNRIVSSKVEEKERSEVEIYASGFELRKCESSSSLVVKSSSAAKVLDITSPVMLELDVTESVNSPLMTSRDNDSSSKKQKHLTKTATPNSVSNEIHSLKMVNLESTPASEFGKSYNDSRRQEDHGTSGFSAVEPIADLNKVLNENTSGADRSSPRPQEDDKAADKPSGSFTLCEHLEMEKPESNVFAENPIATPEAHNSAELSRNQKFGDGCLTEPVESEDKKIECDADFNTLSAENEFQPLETTSSKTTSDTAEDQVADKPSSSFTLCEHLDMEKLESNVFVENPIATPEAHNSAELSRNQKLGDDCLTGPVESEDKENEFDADYNTLNAENETQPLEVTSLKTTSDTAEDQVVSGFSTESEDNHSSKERLSSGSNFAAEEDNYSKAATENPIQYEDDTQVLESCDDGLADTPSMKTKASSSALACNASASKSSILPEKENKGAGEMVLQHGHDGTEGASCNLADENAGEIALDNSTSIALDERFYEKKNEEKESEGLATQSYEGMFDGFVSYEMEMVQERVHAETHGSPFHSDHLSRNEEASREEDAPQCVDEIKEFAENQCWSPDPGFGNSQASFDCHMFSSWELNLFSEGEATNSISADSKVPLTNDSAMEAKDYNGLTCHQDNVIQTGPSSALIPTEPNETAKISNSATEDRSSYSIDRADYRVVGTKGLVIETYLLDRSERLNTSSMTLNDVGAGVRDDQYSADLFHFPTDENNTGDDRIPGSLSFDQLESIENANSAVKEGSATEGIEKSLEMVSKENEFGKEGSLIRGTLKKPVTAFDMKENASSVKQENFGSVTAKSTVKRRALSELQK